MVVKNNSLFIIIQAKLVILLNSCPKIYLKPKCRDTGFVSFAKNEISSRNTIIHEWNLGEGCQTFEGNSGNLNQTP